MISRRQTRDPPPARMNFSMFFFWGLIAIARGNYRNGRHLLNAKDSSEDGFEINRGFLENTNAAQIIIPSILLHKFEAIIRDNNLPLTHAADRGVLNMDTLRDVMKVDGSVEVIENEDGEEDSNLTEIGVARLNIQNKRARRCAIYYFKGTVQYKQCLAGKAYAWDPLNIGNTNFAHSCMINGLPLLKECCSLLEFGRKGKIRECIRIRLNIIARGIQVCMMRNAVKRALCCRTVFLGRRKLINQCQNGIPTYIDRRAPCVFKSSARQMRCCALIFPRYGDVYRVRAYFVCRGGRHGLRTMGGPICSTQTGRRRQNCCHQLSIYGIRDKKTCLSMRRPVCSYPNFLKRLACCQHKYSFDSNKMDNCLSYRFIYCRHHKWINRITCCAMAYKIGSNRLRNCMYKWMSVTTSSTLKGYNKFCRYRHPPGSQMYTLCILYPFLQCRGRHSTTIPWKDTVTLLQKCCEHMFSKDARTCHACIVFNSQRMSIKQLEFHVIFLYRTLLNVRIRQLSNPMQKLQKRIDHCFKVKRRSRWLWMACLIEMSFDTLPGAPMYFSMYTGNQMELLSMEIHDVCAIYDPAERLSCCKLLFPGTNSNFQTCFSWEPATYVKNIRMPTYTRKDRNRSDWVHSNHNANDRDDDFLKSLISSLEKSTGRSRLIDTRVVNREQITMFLMVVKAIENEKQQVLYEVQMDDISQRIDPRLEEVYDDFKKLYTEELRKGRLAVIWHAAKEEWAACATVTTTANEGKISQGNDQRDAGITYCGSIETLVDDSDAIMQGRVPYAKWDAGLLMDVVRYAKFNVGRGSRIDYTSRTHNPRAAAAFLGKRSGAEYQDSASVSEEGSASKNSSQHAIMVSLLGQIGCTAYNMRFKCSALCCDSYFAYSWVCNSKNMFCVT